MKTFVKIITLFLLLNSIIISQPVLSIENIADGIYTNNVSVTVSLDDTVSIKSFAMSVKYSPNFVTFLEDLNRGTGISNNNFPGPNFMYSAKDGIITIAWVSETAIEIVNNLFDLNFRFDAGFSELEILTAQMKNSLGQKIDVQFSHGSIAENNSPQVRLVAPNGGEYFGVTEPPQNITWTSVYVDFIDIAYSVDGANWLPVADDVDALDGKFLWTIPDINSSTVKVKVSDVSDSLGVNDESDNVFEINSAQSITLLSPNGGDVLQHGGAKVIKWTSENVANVLIEYSKNNGSSWTTIVASTNASDDSYIWDVPSETSIQCLVRISNVDNPVISDISDNNFTITPDPVEIVIPHIFNTYPGYPNPPGPPPAIYTPELSDILTELPITSGWLNAVTSLVITIGYDKEAVNFTVWDDFVNTTSVLYKKGNFIPSFDDSTITLFWNSQTPHDLQGELFLLRCQYSDGTDVIVDPDSMFSEFKILSAKIEDVKGNIIDLDLSSGSVSKTDLAAVKLHNPKGGEVLALNTSPLQIEFSSVNLGAANVHIDFSSNGGSNWSDVGSGIDPKLGVYSWDYSSYSNSANCAIYLSSSGTPTDPLPLGDDVSGIFEITNSKKLELLSPNGGEIIQKGRAKNIKWSGFNVDSISIDFSSDNGSTWESIVASFPAIGGNYTWDVPDITSTECLIEITDVADTNRKDISQSVFTIADNRATLRLSRIGNLVVAPQPPPPLPRVNQLPIYIDFEHLNSITYFALQFSFDNTVYRPNKDQANRLKASALSALVGGNFNASVSDTMISIMWSSAVPVDLNGTLIEIDGEYLGGTTDLRFISAQFFDISGVSMTINKKDGRLSDSVVGIDEIEETAPKRYFIDQNYPNPFNPSTTIKYGIPEQSRVSLVVYNTLGQKVATLVDEIKNAGIHSVNWNAVNLANGVYFYRIIVENYNSKSGQSFIDSKKLLLLK